MALTIHGILPEIVCKFLQQLEAKDENRLYSLITKKDIEDYLNGEKESRMDVIEKALKEIVLVNPISLKKLMQRIINGGSKNNQDLASAVYKLGDIYWSCFRDELEKKHINSIELDNNYSANPKESFDIINGRFRTIQGIANRIGRNREDVSEVMKKIGIKKNKEKSFENNDVILIEDLFNNYKNQDDRIAEGLRIKKGNSLSFISYSDLAVLKSKKLNKMNKKTGVFED